MRILGPTQLAWTDKTDTSLASLSWSGRVLLSSLQHSLLSSMCQVSTWCLNFLDLRQTPYPCRQMLRTPGCSVIQMGLDYPLVNVILLTMVMHLMDFSQSECLRLGRSGACDAQPALAHFCLRIVLGLAGLPRHWVGWWGRPLTVPKVLLLVGWVVSWNSTVVSIVIHFF